MRSESVVFTVAGMCFGVILGWVLGTQQTRQALAAPAAGLAQAAPETTGVTSAPALDEARVQALMAIAQNDPSNAGARVELANQYYDAERFEDAILWYEQALAIDPADVNASTDLGVSYFYAGRTDRALEQFDRSLDVDPNHVKTLLNQGIVLAFGLQDIDAAAVSWRQAVALAPDSPEGVAASQALAGMATGHDGTEAAVPGP